VLSIDFHLLGNVFVSCGMDNTVKVWSLEGSQSDHSIAKNITESFHYSKETQGFGGGTFDANIQETLKGPLSDLISSTSTSSSTTTNTSSVSSENDSNAKDENGNESFTNNKKKKQEKYKFRPIHDQFPIFSTCEVHSDYVDCVRWIGNLLVSKSTASMIVLWKPDPSALENKRNHHGGGGHSGGSIYVDKLKYHPLDSTKLTSSVFQNSKTNAKTNLTKAPTSGTSTSTPTSTANLDKSLSNDDHASSGGGSVTTSPCNGNGNSGSTTKSSNEINLKSSNNKKKSTDSKLTQRTNERSKPMKTDMNKKNIKPHQNINKDHDNVEVGEFDIPDNSPKTKKLKSQKCQDKSTSSSPSSSTSKTSTCEVSLNSNTTTTPISTPSMVTSSKTFSPIGHNKDEPETPETPEPAAIVLREFEFRDADIWFVRFSLDLKSQLMAIGNKYGRLWIWNIDGTPNATLVKNHGHLKCNSAIRQTAFSPDGKYLVCCCENGSIWKWAIDYYS